MLITKVWWKHSEPVSRDLEDLQVLESWKNGRILQPESSEDVKMSKITDGTVDKKPVVLWQRLGNVVMKSAPPIWQCMVVWTFFRMWRWAIEIYWHWLGTAVWVLTSTSFHLERISIKGNAVLQFCKATTTLNHHSLYIFLKKDSIVFCGTCFWTRNWNW